ncbi:serine/threonine protein kinase [Woeseia oceani]|uniref:Stress response kinase A n=1 Tax=Woeseia oceani TaxID=1548547 RepID=A0A193LGF6_9GAMM|nr:serine/threonine protein kinase [Woeseia oceani]ANO51546.1 stress response serine/threonine protein kinase YihE [Woeseia oceani]
MSESDDSALAYQALQPDDILDTLESLGFNCNGRMLALNSYENRVYQVGIEGDAPVVAKFYRPARWTDEAIEEEHEFAAELAAADIPVVAPLRIHGATLHHHGPFRVSISPCHGGRSPDLDNDDLLRQIGRLVARIHLQGERSEFRHRPHVDIESYGIDSHDYLLDNQFIPEELEEVYIGIADHLFDNIEAAFDRAGAVREFRLHADFHPGNVLVQEDRVHIVDLDDARTGPAVQDLWMFLSGDRDEQTPQLSILLEGYQEFRQFDARELHLIEALRSLRMMHYAAWLARRWEDPAFKQAFPWFNSRRYWDEHVLSLREQTALIQEPPLAWYA